MSSLIKEEDRRQRRVRKEHIVGSVAPLLDLVVAVVAAPARRIVSQQFTKGNWRSRRRDAAARRRDGAASVRGPRPGSCIGDESRYTFCR